MNATTSIYNLTKVTVFMFGTPWVTKFHLLFGVYNFANKTCTKWYRLGSRNYKMQFYIFGLMPQHYNWLFAKSCDNYFYENVYNLRCKDYVCIEGRCHISQNKLIDWLIDRLIDLLKTCWIYKMRIESFFRDFYYW